MDAKRERVAAAEDRAFAGDLPGAAACLREACDDDPADPDLWFLLGYYLAEAGRPGEAIQPLREALALASGHGQAHHALANCLRDTGQIEPAAGHYRRSLEVLEDDGAVIADFGLCFLRAGEHDMADALFRRALDLDPACELALLGLADLGSPARPATLAAPAGPEDLPAAPAERGEASAPARPRPRPERRLRGPAARSAGLSANGRVEAPAPPEGESALPDHRGAPIGG